MKMESQPVEVLNTMGSGEHPNEIILSNFEGLATETVTSDHVNNQVVEYIQVPAELDGNGTIFAQEIELSHPFYFNQEGDGNEIFVVVRSDQDTPTEQSIAQIIQNGGVNSSIPIQFADNGLVRSDGLESSIVSPALESATNVTEASQEYQSMLIPEDGLNEVAVNEVTVKGNSGVWTYAEEKVDEKDGGTEVLFIPNSKITSAALLTALDKNSRKLLQISSVPQKYDQEHESSELIHDFGVAESEEAVTTNQQDKNVSSNCSFSSQKISSSNFPANNANEMPLADFSNEGLDLSMNKTVQGVSVIHVTSSSDLTLDSGVLNNNELKMVEVKTNANGNACPVENTGCENNVQCATALNEQQMTETTVDIERESELKQGQILTSDDKYQLPEKQDFSNQVTNPIEGFICTEKIDKDPENSSEALIVNEAINSRSSSVLVYSGKEIPDNQHVESQTLPIVQDESSVVTAPKQDTVEQNNLTEQFLNENEDCSRSEFSEDVKSGECAEREVRKSVLSCKPFNKNSDFEKNISESYLDVNGDNPNELNHNTEVDTDQNANNDTIEPDGIQPSTSFLSIERVTESPNTSVNSSLTVIIKSSQKTFRRRSKRQSKNKKTEKVHTDKQVSKQLSDEETVKLIIDEIKNYQCETNDITPSIVCEENIANTPLTATIDNAIDSASEHSSDSKTDIPNSVLDHYYIVDNERVKNSTEGSKSPKISLSDTASSSAPSETILQPPKKTYLRKRKQILSSEVSAPKEESTCLDGDIELFSCADYFDDDICNKTVNIPKPSEDREAVTENSKISSIDDDDLLLFSSDIRSKGSTTYKRHKTSETPNVPEFLDAIRKRTTDNKNAAKHGTVVAVASTSQITAAIEATSSVSEVVPSPDAMNTSSPPQPKRSKRLLKKATEEEPLVKKQCQDVPSNTLEKPLDIENDINAITAPAGKKGKRKSSSYVVPETAFYPNTSPSFLRNINKMNKKKQGSCGSPRKKKAMSQSVILSHSNGSLTRGQLHSKMNEYNFSDSEETYSEDNMESRGYVSETFNKKKRGRPVSTKNKPSTSSLTWDKFVNSSPDKKKKENYLKKFNKRKNKARRSSECDDKSKGPNLDDKQVHFSPQPYNENVEGMSTSSVQDSPKKKGDGFCYYMIQEEGPSPKRTSEEIFQCFNCEFETKRINNYCVHLKDCLKSLKANVEEITDMDRRQQIRGEEQSSQNSSLASIKESIAENSIVSVDEDMEIDDELQKEASETGFEYSKNDIVWVEVKRVYWPSLVLNVHPDKNKVTVFLIDSAFNEGRKKSLTVDVQFLQSFNDSKMHKKLLNDGKNEPNGDKFIMAVQRAEDFLRKRKCLGINVPMRQFFKNLPGDHVLDNSDTDVNDDDILRTLNLTADALKLIKSGTMNELLVNISKQKVESSRHMKFLSDDPVVRNELESQTWFGPLIMTTDQTNLYTYLSDVLRENSNHRVYSTFDYITWVLCPEALIRAIALVDNISDIDAEKIFCDPGVRSALSEIIKDH